MLHQAAKGSGDLSSVRFGLCGGAPLSLTARNDFERKMKFRILNCYGSTETPLMAAFERPDSPAKGASVGKISPHVRVRLVTARGTIASSGEEGEIHLYAQNALKCYWNNPDATRNSIRDGWFATGDIGKFDEEGRLHVVDRAKDMIIRGGFNIYPAELERVLLQDPRITEAVVIGEPHERLGEVPKAYVVVADDVHITEAEIIARSREQLASFKVPEKVEFVPSAFFPRNALGKVLKHKLRHGSGAVPPDHIGQSNDGLYSQGERCGNTTGR
jgi:long-chain acyl-CoA synthetase